MSTMMPSMTNYNNETPALQALLTAADGQAPFPPPTEAFIATTLKEIAVVLRAIDERCSAIERGLGAAGIPTIRYTTDVSRRF